MRRGSLVFLLLASLLVPRTAHAGPYDVILADGADVTLCFGCGIVLAGLDYGLLVNTGTSDITLDDLMSARFSVTSTNPAIVLYPFINIPNPQIVGAVHPGEAMGSIISGNQLLLPLLKPGETLRNLSGLQFMAYQIERPGVDPYEGPVDFDVIMSLAGYLARFTIHAEVHLGQHQIIFTHATRVTASPGTLPSIDCSAAAASPAVLWPPNHRLVPVSITGVTTDQGLPPSSIIVTDVTQDEAPGRTEPDSTDLLGNQDTTDGTIGGNEDIIESGQGHGRRSPGHRPPPFGTCPDAVIQDGQLFLRAERSAHGNGRVYVIYFTARDSNGTECTSNVGVCVPRNAAMDDSCQNDGQTFNSLERCSPTRGTGHLPENLSLMAPAVAPGVVVFSYTLDEPADLELDMFDIAGRHVATLERGLRMSGSHSVTWSSSGLSQGVYFVRARAGQEVMTRTVVLARR
jgi:hypothetical protein